MDSTTIQERRRINDEIERLAMLCMDFAGDYDTYMQTQRSAVVLDLYEGFYHSFSRLVRYTRNLPQLRNSRDEIITVTVWLKEKTNTSDDKRLVVRMDKGTELFDSYMKLLADEGVVFPPSK
jgi:hypothetical protein